MTERDDLERLDRESLVLRAQTAGIRRARVLTRPELIDELLRLDESADPTQLKKSRGFFGIARDLLSRVVERGLHLPDAADRLRAAFAPGPQVPRPEPQAVPTVTLAEIYAAQGHKQRAIETLRRVLETEPEHVAARALLEKLEAADYVAPPLPLPPEQDEPPAEIGANLGTRVDPDPEPEPEPEKPEPELLVMAPAIDPPEPSEPEPFIVAPTPEPPVAPEPPMLSPIAAAPAEDHKAAACVAIPLSGGFYVWWRLRPRAEPQAQIPQPQTRFVIRAVVIVPSWEGPQRASRDVPCGVADVGEVFLHGFPPHAVVRIAVGSVGPDAVFTPVAHSPALEGPSPDKLVRWTVDGHQPIGASDHDAADIALACAHALKADAPTVHS
jgi:hypothetical protein